MITPKNRYTAFKEAILNAPSETHCWPFSEKYSEGEVGELLKSVLESTEGQCIEGSEHLAHHVKVASELNRCYKDYYQMMQSLFSKTDLDGLDLSEYIIALANCKYYAVKKRCMDELKKYPAGSSINFVQLTNIEIDTDDGGRAPAKECLEAIHDGANFVLNYLRYFDEKTFCTDEVNPDDFVGALDAILLASASMATIKGAYDNAIYDNGFMTLVGRGLRFNTYDHNHSKLVYAGQLMLQNRYAEVFSKYGDKNSQFSKYFKNSKISGVTINDGVCSFKVVPASSVEFDTFTKEMQVTLDAHYEYLDNLNLPKAGGITIEEVLAVWIALRYILSTISVVLDWDKPISRKEELSDIPRKVNKEHLVDVFSQLCIFDKGKIERALSLMVNDRKKNKYLWESPIYDIKDHYVIAIFSVVDAQIYNLIDSIIKRGGVDLDVRGKMFERYLHRIIPNCNKQGYKVVMPQQQQFKGEEIDILISLKDLVIVADAKCIRHSMEANNRHDDWNTIIHASEQATKKLEYVKSHQEEFEPLIGDYSKKQFMPLVVTNYPFYTGCDVDGIYVIDSHSLIAYLRTGSVALRQMDAYNSLVSGKFLYTTETEMSSNFFDYCKHNPVKEYLMPHIQMVEYPLNTNKNAPVTSVGPTFHMSIKGEEADNSSDGKCVDHE